MDKDELQLFTPLYAFVRSLPPGRVVTYGQAAALTEGVSLTARQVGAAMRFAPPDVPWQRVVGAGGTLPIGKLSPELRIRQRQLLEKEGVIFLPQREDRIDMAQCQYHLPASEQDQASLFDEH